MKINNILIGTLISLNIAFRLPTTPHEIGIDSIFIHTLSNSISNSGHIPWAIHPLSLFGIYPFSYPTASPTLISIISLICGKEIEETILALGMALAILGVVASYAMAREICDDELFSIFTAFSFSTAPIFIELTRWTASTRNMFIAVFPLVLWAIFKLNKICDNNNSRYYKYYILLAIILITLFATHRLSFLMPLVLISYIMAAIISRLKKQDCVIKFLSELPRNSLFFMIVLMFIFVFSIQFTGIGFYGNVWHYYETGALAEGKSIPILLLNMLTNYTGQIGIFIVFGLMGFLVLIRKQQKNFNEIFIIFVLLGTTGLSALGIYIAPFLLPIIGILIAYFLYEVMHLLKNPSRYNKKQECFVNRWLNNLAAISNRTLTILIVLCLITSIGFSFFMIQRHLNLPIGKTEAKLWTTEEVINAGFFLKDIASGPFIYNDALLAERISAFTKAPYFSGDINGLINGWIREEELESIHAGWKSFSIETDYLFALNSSTMVDKDFKKIYKYNFRDENSDEILDKYDINTLIINNAFPKEITKFELETEPSKYLCAVTSSGVRVYDNSKQSIWQLR